MASTFLLRLRLASLFVAVASLTCAASTTAAFAGNAFSASSQGGGACSLTPAPELLAALREIGNDRVRVTVFTGRRRSGVSTLAHEVSAGQKCTFVSRTPAHHADGSSVNACLAPASSTGAAPNLWIDVHTADGAASDACPLALTAAAALVADALVVADFETVTSETLAAAEHTARFAEVLAAAVASRHSVDDTLRRIEPPSSSAGGSNALQPPSRLLVLAANKIDTDCADDSAMEQYRAGLEARVVEDMKRAKGVVAAAGDGGVDADDGPEFDDLLGLAQTFDVARVATIRHRKVCGDPALRADAADLRSIVLASSLPLRTGAQLADTIEAAAREASNPGTVPARPRPWLLWVREMANAAVSDAQQFFRLALEEGTVPRNSGGRVASGDAADLGSPSASDAESFRSQALVVARPGTRAPKTVPTLNDFDRLASGAASAATDMVRRRLFSAAPKRKLAELARVMASDAKRFKATLAATTEKMFRDFADECAAYGAASRDIAVLPVADSAIDAWAKKYGDFCDARFTRHLGAHRAQLEGTYDAARKGLRAGIDKHALATKAQSGDRLLLLLRQESSLIVDGVTQRRLRVQEALTRAVVEQHCAAAKSDGQKELTAAAERRIGAWATTSTVFPEAARRLDAKFKSACADALAANAVRVRARMQRVVDDAAGPFERMLHAIVLPVDREQIHATAAKEEARAVKSFQEALAGFAVDETSESLADLRARMGRVRTHVVDSNTELWQQKLVSLRQCASGIVQDAIFDAWYFSPVHYSAWWVRWCLSSAVHHCAQHNTATASIPGGVPASTLQDVIDWWLTRDARFGRLLDRAGWNQKLLGLVVVAAAFLLYRAATGSQADAAARDAGRGTLPAHGQNLGLGRRTGYYASAH